MKRFGIATLALGLIVMIGASANYVFNRVCVRFEHVAVGGLAMPPDGRGGFISFETSDGVNLTYYQLRFRSPESARKAFQKVISESTRVIDRETLYDREGKTIVGERVIAMFPSDLGTECPMMVSQDGRYLYEVSSTSLRHIALYEKRYRRY